MSELTVVTRPNGKVYRARKAAACVGFNDDEDYYAYVAALRTHDVDLAASFARPYRGEHLHFERLAWIRQTIRGGEPWFEEDAVRGVPAVVFIECYEGSCATDERKDPS